MAKTSKNKPVKQARPVKQSKQGKDEAVDIGKVILSWQALPCLREKKKTAILIASTLVFGAMVWYSFSDLLAGIIAIVISIASFGSFLFPSKYVLTEDGLQVKNGINAPVFRRWAAFSGYVVFSDGIQLTYHPRRIRERILRGHFVYFEDADKEKITEVIKANVDPAPPPKRSRFRRKR